MKLADVARIVSQDDRRNLTPAEAKLRIDRRIGQVLAEVPREKPGRRAGNTSSGLTQLQATGITRPTQRALEQSALVPEAAFEAFVAVPEEACGLP